MIISLKLWLPDDITNEPYPIIGLLALATAGFMLLYTRGVVKKIEVLDEWTEAILQGKLDMAVEISVTDKEISRLTQALSRMLDDMKKAHASASAAYKMSLEKKQESAEQKRLAEAAQVGTRYLSEALIRMKESQQALAQRERRHVLEQIVRGVVHSFGETLMPIMGGTEILLAHPEDMADTAKMTEHLKMVLSGIARTRQLLKNLAGIFRAPGGNIEPTDINRLFNRAIELIEPCWKEQASQKGIKFEVTMDLQPVPKVASEGEDLQKAIEHLLLNAVEAMPQGGTLTLLTYADKDFVSLEVRDTGRGMSEEVKARCLEPFFSTKGLAGAGMGLTIVSSIVNRHRGVLNIESRDQQGTSVIMKIPIWTGITQEKEQKKADLLPVAFRPLSILVVDDDDSSRKIAARLLNHQGHSVDTASGGKEGLEKVRLKNYDVIIVDRAMLGMDGIVLSRSIKAIFPDMPIIMLSGYADIMIKEGRIPESIDVMLAKPATLADFREALDKAMSKKKNSPA